MSRYHQYRESKKTCEWFPCLLGMMVFATACAALSLIVCGLVVARPGLPAINFEETTCTVTNWTFVKSKPCECAGSGGGLTNCKTYFPCLQVIVEYQIGQDNESSIESILYEHESNAYSKHSDCSLHSCNADSTKGNEYKVSIFKQEYGEIGMNYTCYYDTKNIKRVILSRYFSTIGTILSLAIPGGIFLITFATVVIVCVFLRKRRRKKRRSEPERPIPQRSYLNPSVIIDNGDVLHNPSSTLPGCCESETYMRQEDPSPPSERATDAF